PVPSRDRSLVLLVWIVRRRPVYPVPVCTILYPLRVYGAAVGRKGSRTRQPPAERRTLSSLQPDAVGRAAGPPQRPRMNGHRRSTDWTGMTIGTSTSPAELRHG